MLFRLSVPTGDTKVHPRAYIAHSIPGRIRIKVPDGKGNPALLEKLRELLQSAPAVKTVDCNPLTGSVLIHYSPQPNESIPAFLSAGNGSTPPFLLDPAPSNRPRDIVRKRARREKPHSEAAQGVIGFFRDLDLMVRDATGDQLDLKLLLPLVAGLLGVALLPRTASTPLWVTLMIFAFSSFLVLHVPGSAEAEAATEIAEIATGA